MKNVAIDVGTVAVSGVPAGARNGEAVGRGIESALGRLLAHHTSFAPRDAASLSLPNLQLPHNATDAEIAEAVAAALDRSIRGSGR
jgi:hypothetical protein